MIKILNQRTKPFPHDYLLKHTVLLLVPRWFRPNHFTIMRLLATPFVMWLVVTENYKMGIPLFLAAALTDLIDGSLARTREQITITGTILDPIADRILISSVVIVLIFKHLNIYLAGAILMMEAIFIIGGYLHTRKGVIMTGNILGKTKMVLQVFGVGFLLVSLGIGYGDLIYISEAALLLSVGFGFSSLIIYGLKMQ